MGNFIYSVTKCNFNNINASFNPSNREWLSVHSLESGLNLYETERLWTRFQQLGCDSNGMWTREAATKSKTKISKDQLQMTILSHLHAPDKKYVTFYDFVQASVWLEKSSIDDKLKASFAIINSNNPITVESLRNILYSMFPGKTENNINLVVENLFDRIGVENYEKQIQEINEEDFLFFLKSTVPRERLDEIFRYRIAPRLNPIPVENENATPRQIDLNWGNFPNNSSIPTDAQLDVIAANISSKDYTKLASLLGILQYDILHIESINRGNRNKIVSAILREWKLKEGGRAFFSVLKRALYEAGFTQILNQIEFG